MGLESGDSGGADQKDKKSAGANPEDIAKALEGLLKEGFNVRRKHLPISLLRFKVAL